jgi:GntR family transcriptional repressor for pyruvate dehydrogenase complex
MIGEIVDGELAEGEALPREVDLASRFEISRGTARECIRGLEERGLISVKHGRGATVNPSERWDTLDRDVLAVLLAGPGSAAALSDFLECRRVLEIEAAGLAAERATDQDIARLTQALEKMESAAKRAAANPASESLFHEADATFHRTLMAATGNHALLGLTSKIHTAMLAAQAALARPESRADRALPEHRRILAAVARRSPSSARRAMAQHLQTIAGYLAEYTADRE